LNIYINETFLTCGVFKHFKVETVFGQKKNLEKQVTDVVKLYRFKVK